LRCLLSLSLLNVKFIFVFLVIRANVFELIIRSRSSEGTAHLINAFRRERKDATSRNVDHQILVSLRFGKNVAREFDYAVRVSTSQVPLRTRGAMAS